MDIKYNPQTFDISEWQVIIDAIACFGEKAQIMVAIEEAGEFTAAMSRFLNRDKPDLAQDARGEVADMLIMANQMRIILGTNEVDCIIEEKLERVRKRIDRKAIE